MNKRKVLSILLLALITVTLAVSCSGSIDAPVQDAEELAYVTFGNGHSRGLSTSYKTEAYDKLYWFYTALKTDSYGTTGQVGLNTDNLPTAAVSKGDNNAPAKGLSGQVGPFSQGAWDFTLYAYKEAERTTLVYQSEAVHVILKGNEVKNVPVSVSLKGATGLVNLSGAWFEWANQSDADGNISVTVELVKDGSTPNTYFFGPLTKSGVKYTFASNDDNIQVNEGYYTCTVNAYMEGDVNVSADTVNADATPLATQTLGLRVYGNATTYITGNLTEGIFSEVVFKVAEQDMKVFVPAPTGTTKIENINVFPDTTTVTGVTKSTTVEFDQGALTAVANKTLQLDVKVTPVESANEKFNITGTDQNNKSAFAGIDVTLWATDSTGSSEVNSFTEGKYATVTTYIAKGLTGVAVKYNGTDKEQPIATANTGVGVDTTIADILTSDTGTALGYNPSTGLLRFKTNHFSEYYVLAKCVALNETTNVGYGDLQKAFDNAKDSDVIKLIDNITSTTGFSFNNNAKVTFDLNEKILKVTNDTANNHRALKVTAGTLTIKNGTIDARNVNGNGDPEDFNNKDQHTQGIYGTVRVETANVNSPAKAILENLALYNNHLWGMSVKVCENSNAEVKNCNFISRVGGCIEAEGGIVNVESSSFSQEVTSNYSSYISTGIAVSYLGSITVNNTESFNVSGAQAIYVYSSGGEIIVNGGNYSATGNNAVIEADFDKNNYGSQNGIDEFKNSHNGKASVVVVNDGNFVGSFKYGGDTEYCQIKIKGGTFSTNPSDYVPAFGYKVEQNTDVNFVVSEAPLEINNAQDLMNFAASVNAGNDYEGKTITLNADIDLNNEEWTPIGQKDGNKFSGTFDGNSKEISGLYIIETNETAIKTTPFDGYVGLFGAIDGATIKDLTVRGSVKGSNAAGIVARMDSGLIENCNSYVNVVGASKVAEKGKAGGIVCLTNTGDCTISNCLNYGSVSTTKEDDNDGFVAGTTGGVAGIVGYVNKNTSITSCKNYGSIGSSKDKYGAGIAGYVTKGGNINISGCINEGTVSASLNAGGIVGISTDISSIINCDNSGSISAGDNGHAGGIAGSTSQSSITECRNTASVYGKYAGGVIGVDAASIITNCSGGTADITSPAHVIGFTGHSFTLSVAENKSSGRILGAHQGAGPDKYTVLVLDDNNSDSNTIPTVGICGNTTTMPILKISSGTFYGDPLAGNGSTIILESSANWGSRVAGTYTRGGVTESSRIAEWIISNN